MPDTYTCTTSEGECVYGTAQWQLDNRMRSAGSAPKGDISTTHYGHAGAYWDFSCVEQSLPVTSVGVLKLPTQAVYHQAYYA